MRLSLFAPIDALIAPPPVLGRVAFLKAQPYAHRGLHGGNRIENSRAAFLAAIEAGHGIELDVQMSRDAVAMVFHDETLNRLTDAAGLLIDRTSEELADVKLRGTDEGIPTLQEILNLVGGRVPILIEIKSGKEPVGRLCLAVRRALEGSRGTVAIMSFNPDVGRWFNRHAPRIVRGLVVTEEGRGEVRGRIERRLSLWRAKPDFLAYDVRDFPSAFAARQRRRGLPVLTWTVRTAENEKMAAAHADEVIYEATGGIAP